MIDTFDSLFPTLNTVTGTGVLRTQPKDFLVVEHNDLVFTEEGEHLWLKVEKVNSNTAWVATQISSACKVPARQVGFAGLKDRHAITQQWFSVQLPKIKDLALIKDKLPDEIKVLESHWHKSKIKSGFLSCNEFKIRLQKVTGDKQQIDRNIAQIKINGVPNYFGSQRFGHDMANIQKVQDWFAGNIKVNNKNLRGLLISTARSHIFNQIVALRIAQGDWDQVIAGDLLQLNGSHSWFPASEASEQEINQRLNQSDIHLTAALWGEDQVQSSERCAEMEQQIADTLPVYQRGFTQFRVKQDRRAIRVIPDKLTHEWQENELLLNFKLPPGAYATGVIREIVHVTEHNRTTNE